MRHRNGTPADDARRTARLSVVAAVGFLLLVPPVLSAFNDGGQVLGLPVVWVYLFAAWAVIIGLIALNTNGSA